MRSKPILVLGVLVAIFIPRVVSAQAQSGPEEKIERVGGAIKPPQVAYTRDPGFSETARAAAYQGMCTLTLIVEVDGRPSNIRVVKPIGMGLDEKAVEAVSSWRFSPALKDGKPVRVQIAVEVEFHLFQRSDSTSDLRAKADAGDAKAQLEMAIFFFKYRDVPENEPLGLSYLEKAANQVCLVPSS